MLQSCDMLHTIKVKLYMTFPLPYLSSTHARCLPAFLLQLGLQLFGGCFCFLSFFLLFLLSSAMTGIIICFAALATLTCGL